MRAAYVQGRIVAVAALVTLAVSLACAPAAAPTATPTPAPTKASPAAATAPAAPVATPTTAPRPAPSPVSTPSPTPAPTKAATERVVPKGRALVAISSLGREVLDPHSADGFTRPIRALLWNGIVDYGVNGDYKDGVAQSWEISADGRAWTFKLRKDVKFHDGVGLTANDVVYSFNRLRDPETRTIDGVALVSAADRIEKTDDFTVIIYTKDVFPDLRLNLAADTMAILPQKYSEEVGRKGVGNKPVGTGPFKFVERSIGDYIQVEGFASYFKTPPYVKDLRMRVVPEAATRLAMLKIGEADVIDGAGGPMLPELRKDARLKSILNPAGSAAHIHFAEQIFPGNPQADVRARKALNYAVNKKALAETVYYGGARPGVGQMGPADWAYDPQTMPWVADPYPYDPAKAKQLLAEAGYPNGFEVTLNVYRSGSTPLLPELGEAVVGYLEAVLGKGKVRYNFMEGGLHSAKIRDETIGGLALHQNPLGFNSSRMMDYYYSSEALYGFVHDKELDKLLAAEVKELDNAKRVAPYRQAHKYHYDNAYSLYLLWVDTPFAASARVEEWRPQPGNSYFVNMETLKLKQ